MLDRTLNQSFQNSIMFPYCPVFVNPTIIPHKKCDSLRNICSEFFELHRFEYTVVKKNIYKRFLKKIKSDFISFKLKKG